MRPEKRIGGAAFSERITMKSKKTISTAEEASQIIQGLYNALGRSEQKKLMAFLVRQCCSIQLKEDAIDPEHADDWIANLIFMFESSVRFIEEIVPVINVVERLKPKEKNPERNASVREDRKRGLTRGQLAKKHKISLKAVDGILRRKATKPKYPSA